MGWNKQSGDAWVLQRTIDGKIGVDTRKALALRVTGLLTIEDADALMRALHAEIVAARKSEGDRFKAQQVSYGSSVLQNWDQVLGVELQPWQQKIAEAMLATDAPICRKCGSEIRMDQTAFGSKATGWEHMAGECETHLGGTGWASGPKSPPADIEDDDGCPND